MQNIYRFYRQIKLQKQDTHYSAWFKLVLPVIGFLALIWFLVRVIPKPSRATYPCQRIAFPLASSFIIWLIGIVGALSFLKKARSHLNRRKIFLALACFAVSVSILWASLGLTFQEQALAQTPIPNDPMGVAKGIFPGRVVWVHDPNATDWNGPGTGDGYSWQPANTPQKYVDAMVSKSVRELAGVHNDYAAWGSLFTHFNINYGKGEIGYTPGEKIVIKINLTTCNTTLNSVNSTTYDKTKYLDKSDTSPQLIIGLLRQLVYKAGVDPADIAVGDTLTYFPNQWWDICHGEFPAVTYFDKIGRQGRVKSTPSNIQQHWSHGLVPDLYEPDYIPLIYAEADYLINIAVLKSHSAGITLCAKNHYGSYNRTPVDSGYYNLHNSLAYNKPAEGQYRALVDIMGHPHMGGKTLLYMIDGLYGGDNWDATARKFQMDPFYDDWPSSIFVSQDPVAIDSVGLDILWAEGWSRVRNTIGLDDYLKEAALANDSPSETFYDPDGDGVALESLGVHERWNNAEDRQYSRNLGSGDGIELLYVKLNYYSGDMNSDDRVELDDLFLLLDCWLWVGDPGAILEDIIEDGYVNLEDFRAIAENWEVAH